MEKTITLSILKTENGACFYRLEKSPISAIENISLDTELFNRINSEIKKLTKLSSKAETRDLDEELKKLGQLLFEQFVPKNTKTLLRSSETGDLILRLEEPFLEIPWEIAFDGNSFIGNKFRIGRNILRTSLDEITQTGESIQEKRVISILIIADPTETLSGASEEAHELCDLLDRYAEFQVEIIAGKEYAKKIEILKEIRNFDCVHFAGHSVSSSDNPNENGWKLSDGFLTPEEIRNNGNPPKLIFSNSCSSASISSSEICTGNLGLGGSFLMAGATHYIGTLWVIHDNSSVKFAEFFYSKLVSGVSVGEALHYAKNQSIALQPKHAFIWASYVHYGDPQDQLFASLKRDIVEKSEGKTKVGQNNFCTSQPFSPNDEDPEPTPVAFSYATPLIATALIGLLLIGGYWFWSKFPDKRNRLIIDMYSKAVSDYKDGQTESAHAAFTHLVGRKDNPKGIGTAYLSQIYSEAGLPEQAEFFIEKAIKKNPNGIMGNIISGDREWRTGFPKKAAKAYLFALEDPFALDWQKARAVNSLGSVSFFMGNIQNAEKYFLKALPQNETDAASNLGVMEYFLLNDEKAIQWFKKASNASPDDEIADLFIRRILLQPLVKMKSGASGKKVAAGPFIFAGGIVSRIGVDILLCEATAQAIRKYAPEWDCSVPDVYGPNYPDFRINRLAGLRKLTDHLRSLGFRLVVFGEFSTTEHILAVHLKVADIETGKMYLSKKFRSEMEQRVNQTIVDIQGTLSSSIPKAIEEISR